MASATRVLGSAHSGEAARLPRPPLARILSNETAKSLLILWAHRATVLPEIGLFAVTYVTMQYVIGEGSLVQDLLPATLLGFVAYAFTYHVMMKVTAGTLEEVNTGTFEQTHLSPVPPWLLATGRLAAATLEALGVAAIVGVGLGLVLDIDIPARAQVLVPVLLTVVDVAGFALLLGGIALTLRSIGAVIHVIQSLILFVGGSLIPIETFPTWLEVLAKLTPSALGVDVARRILFDDETLAGTWADRSLVLLVVHAVAMAAIGWVVYQRHTARALRDGRLGP